MIRIPLLLVLSVSFAQELITFQTTQLSEDFYGEGAHAADFNNDGKVDLVSGPYWYAGPEFTERHEYRSVKAYDPQKYSDNFLTYVSDFNGDGWEDILIIGWPGYKKDHEHRWYENPQGKEGHWTSHLAFKTVDNESPMLVQVVGDDKPELVFHTLGRLGYAITQGTNEWAFTPVSGPLGVQRYTHGLGAGDVNGDGRTDLLLAKGWWENTGKPGMWVQHDYPFAPGKGGAQMYVYDVNGDGKNDVITSLNGHGYGLAWYEQTGTDGAIDFIPHVFMNDTPAKNAYGVKFSQLHGVDLADMNGDGLMDIVTGKRWWAHGPKGDEEPNAPAVLYWFELQRDAEGVEWVPHLIDDNSGVGCQVTVTDLNADGAPDVVVGNKKGTFYHLQSRKTVDAETFKAAQPKRLK